MAAWSDQDYRDDRAEEYGRAATYYGHPEPCDDAFWLGVNLRADAIERATTAALEAVDRVIELLPSLEGDPLATRPPAALSPRTEAATGEPSSPSGAFKDAA